MKTLEQKVQDQRKVRDDARVYLGEVEAQEIVELKEGLREIFSQDLEEGDQLQFSSDALYVSRNREDGYVTEIFSIRFKRDYNFETSSYGELKMKLSCYSTSEASDFELKRLVTIGKVASRMLVDSELITEEYNKIKADNKQKKNAAYALYSDEDKRFDAVRLQLQKVENALFLEKMEEVGINFAEPIEVEKSYNTMYRNVTGIKIESRSKSGKKMTVKITQKFQQWDYKEEKSVEHVMTEDVLILTRKMSDQMSYFKSQEVKDEN